MSLIILVLFPITSYAAECSKDGYTVVYVNGILTEESEARANRRSLAATFSGKSSFLGVEFLNGYNETHLAGSGDIYKSIQQALQKPTPVAETDYDLKTILLQIHPQLTTRKILLVGHSQGTFYTNTMYRYLLEHGVPADSIAVYNLATPANYVEGGGRYLTSSNDKLIQEVRAWASGVVALEPLPANRNIPLPPGEENDDWGGHHFGSSYLNAATTRIVSDIESALGKLKADETTEGGCFTPPDRNFGYAISHLAFAAADPASVAIRTTAMVTTQALTSFANAIGNALASFGYRNTEQASAAALAIPSVAPVQPAQASVEVKLPLPVPPPQPPTQLVTPLQISPASPPIPVLQLLPPPPPIPKGPGPYGLPFFPQSGSGAPPVVEVVAEEEQPAAPVIPPADTTPPNAPVASVAECSYSLSTDFCFIPSTSATLAWGNIPDAAYYTTTINDVLGATTTATTTSLTLTNNATNTLAVVAYDAAGNAATSTIVSIFAMLQPVVISEVGWAGTKATSSDQWLELRNLSSYAVRTTYLSLTSVDALLLFSLSSTISANGFFVWERAEEATSYPADVVSDTSLSKIGEELLLTWNAGTATAIDRTPTVLTCGGWCAGTLSSPTKKASSMERITDTSDGSVASSWRNGLPSDPSATDRSGNSICGTPGATLGNGSCTAPAPPTPPSGQQ